MGHRGDQNALILLLIGLCTSMVASAWAGTNTSQQIITRSISRQVDLSSASVHENVHLVVSLSQEHDSNVHATHSVFFALPAAHAASVAFAGASAADTSHKKIDASVNLHDDRVQAPPGFTGASVFLSQPLNAGVDTDIVLNFTYIGLLEAFPQEVPQEERQSMLYSGTQHFPLHSGAQSESLSVLLPAATAHSFTQPANGSATRRGSVIDYGNFSDVPPFAAENLQVHFPSEVTYLVASYLNRELALTHSGELHVTDEMMLRNDGAGLKGGFSRLDFSKGKGSSLTHLQALLPAGTKDVDLSDELGKVTTLRVQEVRNKVQAIFAPRYPLLRGWKAKLVLTYTTPAKNMLHHGGRDGSVTLRIPAWPPVNTLSGVEDFNMRVVLPEGSSGSHTYAGFATSVHNATAKKFTNAFAKDVRIAHKRLLVREDTSAVMQVQFKPSKLELYTGPSMIALTVATIGGALAGIASLPTPSFWRKNDQNKLATKVEN